MDRVMVQKILGLIQAKADSLVCENGAQRILGLLTTHWWVKLDPSVSSCRALGVTVIVPVH